MYVLKTQREWINWLSLSQSAGEEGNRVSFRENIDLLASMLMGALHRRAIPQKKVAGRQPHWAHLCRQSGINPESQAGILSQSFLSGKLNHIHLILKVISRF